MAAPHTEHVIHFARYHLHRVEIVSLLKWGPAPFPGVCSDGVVYTAAWVATILVSEI